MSFTQSSTRGEIHYVNDGFHERFVPKVMHGADTFSAEEEFGIFVLHRFLDEHYSIHLHSVFPKKDVETTEQLAGPFLYVVVVLKGHFGQKLGDLEEIELKDWQFYMTLISKPVSVTSIFKAKTDVQYYSFCISTNLLQKIRQPIANLSSPFLHDGDKDFTLPFSEPQQIDRATFSFVDSLFAEYLPSKYMHYFYELRLSEVVIRLCDLELSKEDRPAISKKDFEAVMEARKLIEAAVIDKYRLSETQLAEKVGLSTRRLKKTFKEAMEMTIGAYIVIARLNYALQLLKDKEKSIKQIAALCGYKHTKNFTTAFRNQFKTTPDAYRTMLI